jgi:adhesin/invasin
MARFWRLILIGIVVFVGLGLPVGTGAVAAADPPPAPVVLRYACVLNVNGLMHYSPNGVCAPYETRIEISTDTPIVVCRMRQNNQAFYFANVSRCTTALGTRVTLPDQFNPVYLCAEGNRRVLRFVNNPSQCGGQLVVVPPPVSLTLSTITANPTSIVANGTATSTITVQLKDFNGNNLTSSAGTVALSTTLGTLSAVTDNANGTYTATLTAGTVAGTAVVGGTLNGLAFTQTASVALTAGPPVGGQSTISANPTSIIANGTSTSTITVRARDQFGNAVATGGATVVLGTTAGTLSAVTDNSNGTYTATLTAPTATGSATVSGTLNGAALANNATVTFIPGPAVGANSVLFAQPSTLTANGTATSSITVRLKDANNNDLTSGGDTVTVSTTLGTISGVTDNGDGTYGATLTAPTTTGSATVSGTVNGSPLGNTRNVDFVPGPADADDSTITANPTSIQVSISPTTSTSTITVQARDQFGNNLTQGGATVLLSTTAGTLSAITDNANGTYTATLTAPALVGTATITGTLNGATIGDTATVTFTAGPPANLAKHAGDGQSATVGTAVAVAPAVRITDANGNPLAGVSVTFAVATGGGSATGTTATTDANGVATVGSWTLGTIAGSNTLTATAGALSATFSATGTPGAATVGQSTITAAPTQVVANGTAFATITVQLKDQYGNNLTASGGVVALSTTHGALSTVTDNTNGTYTATLTSGTAGNTGTATISGTLGGNAIADTATVEFNLLPTKYVVTAASSSVAAGTTVTITAQLAAADNTPVPTAGRVVTWSKTGAGGSFASPTSVTDSSGIATVVFTVGTVAGTTHAVTATDADSLTGTSPDITVVAGPVDLATSTITASPNPVQVSIAPTPSTSTVTVQLKDQYGNNRPTSGGVVALSATNGVSLSAVTDNTNGTYTATLTAPALVGSTVISGTLAGNPLTDTETVTFTPGPLHHFKVELAPSGTIGTQTVGTPFNIKVTAQDANDNIVTAFTGTVDIATTGGTLGTGGGTTAAFVSGVLATHSVNYSAGGLGVTLTATRTSGGSESGTSNAFDVQAPPVANDDGPASNTTAPGGDPYHIALNGGLTAPNLLTNDTPGVPPATIASFGGGSLGGTVTSHAAGSTVTFGTGGSLTVNANGTLSFTPATNFTGNFTFSYRLTNVVGSDDAVVTIAVGVRPSATADTYPNALIGNVFINTTTGTPYSVLTNDQGDQLTITVTGTPTNGTVTLNANGTFVFNPAVGVKGTVATPVNATFQYIINNGFNTPSTGTVTIPFSNDIIWFVNNGAAACPAAPCDGRLSHPFTTLAAFQAANTGGAGNPANGDSIFIYESATAYTGPVTLRNNQRLIGQDSTSTLAALANVTVPPHSALPPMNSANGTATTITNPTATAGADNGVNLASSAGSTNHLYGLTLGNAADVALNGNDFGTLRVAEVIINTTGQAISLTTGTIRDSGFLSVTSSGGTNNIFLSGVTTVGTFDFSTVATPGALSGATAEAFRITGASSGTMIYRGSIANSTNRVVSVANTGPGTCPTLTLPGNLTSSGSGTGILVSNCSAGTITFSGTAKSLTTGTNAAVSLTSNTGATIDFTNGGLVVTTTTGNGFNATGGGTITVRGNGNTLASTGGVALNVTSTNIGLQGLNFRSIAANGGTNGIVLNNTGTTANTHGGLTVSGNSSGNGGGTVTVSPLGTANVVTAPVLADLTGGTIQSTTGDAISLSNTRDVSLTRMYLLNNLGSGIFGDDLTNFTLISSFLDNNGDTATGAEANLRFNELFGTASITNCTIQGSKEDEIRLTPSSGTLTNLAISGTVIGNDFNNTANSALSDNGNGITISPTNTAVVTVNVTNSVIKDVFAAGIVVNGDGTTNRTFNMSNTTITEGADNSSTEQFGGVGISLQGSFSADLTFNLTSNTFLFLDSNAINVSIGTTATNSLDVLGVIDNNRIGNTTIDSGSRDAIGIAMESQGDADAVITVTNNIVRHSDQQGIFMQSRLDDDGDAQTGRLDFTLRNNTVSDIDDNTAFPFTFQHGIWIDSRNTTTLALDIAGNTSTGVGGAAGIMVRNRDTSFFFLERFDDGDGNFNETITNATTVQNFVNAQNPAGGGTLATLTGTFRGFNEAPDNFLRTQPVYSRMPGGAPTAAAPPANDRSQTEVHARVSAALAAETRRAATRRTAAALA